MIKVYMAIFIIAIVSSLSGAAYWYYTSTQKTIAILKENNLKLEMAIKTSEEAIKSLEANYAAASAELQKTNEAFAEIRRQNNRLSSKLANMDLGLIALEKPDSIERAVNRGTKNAGRCFEILSGSPFTEEELNATEAEKFNKECPWLWPGPPASGVSGEQPATTD